MNLFCNYCENEFESNYIKYFCSEECQQSYWADPQKLIISTECPRCHKEFSREIYSLELAMYQALVLCPDCGSEEVTLVGNNKSWKE